MSQTPGEQSGQPATQRAEELLDSIGQRIGLFAARAGQRIQSVASSIREEADRMDQPETATGAKSKTPVGARTEEQGKPARERAEVVVDRMGQRVSNWAGRAGFQVQRAAALMREEVEDIWAEAQNIRGEKWRSPR